MDISKIFADLQETFIVGIFTQRSVWFVSADTAHPNTIQVVLGKKKKKNLSASKYGI